MSKADALQAIIQAAWGDEDPAGGAHLASEWLERERLVDYSTLSKSELRDKAESLRVAADFINIGYMALCNALVAAPSAVGASNARQGGRAKLAKNPEAAAKERAKTAALALWKEREAGKHPKLRTEDQFAIEVCRRWPVLTSIAVVKKWSTSWRAESRRKRASHGK